MSDLDYKLRCPFCNEGMLFWGATGPWRKCPKCDNNLLGNEELWQALIDTKNQLTVERTTHDILQEELKKLQTELERTRKALDVALCSLQDIAESDGDFITGASTPLDEHEYADLSVLKKTLNTGKPVVNDWNKNKDNR